MNTIDYTAKGQKVQFSKKAVNINGKDYAYTGMTAIKHSSAKHLYLFKYEDSWRILPYNDEDEQKLKVIFARIAELNAKRADALARKAAAKAVTVAPPTPKIDVKSIMENVEEAPAEEPAPEVPVEPEPVVEPVEEVPVEPVVEPEPVVEEAPAEEPAPIEDLVEEVPAEPVVEETPIELVEETPVEPVLEPEPVVEETPAEEPAPVEEPVAEVVEEAPAEETPAEEKPAEEKSAEEKPAEETAEPIFPPEEKKKKLKKSFLIFAAVIAAFIILGVIYFFVLGTSNNPTVGPNSDETQQYEDIDGLIEDLQDDN